MCDCYSACPDPEIAKYDYDVLPEISNPYTYTGRRFDIESGLYYYRNRYYDAGLGKFVNRDPIGYVGSE